MMHIRRPIAWFGGLLLAGVVLVGCETGGKQARPGLSPTPVAELPTVAQPTAGSRHWLGPAYWGNRLQDWRFEDGRFVCVTPQGWLGMRTLHDLTRQVTDPGKSFSTSVTVSRPMAEGGAYPGDSAAGVLVGVGKGQMDYRSAAIVHQWSGNGAGLFVGIDGVGQCFIVDNEQAWTLGGAFDASKALPRERWQVTADSFEQDGPPRAAIDGDPSTLWHTEFRDAKPGHPHEMVINLGQEQTFAALAYLPRQDSDSGRVGRFALYASMDGNTWGEAIATGEFPNTAELQVVQFPQTTARYVKLVALSAQRPQPATTVAELWLLSEFVEPGDPGAGLPEAVRLEIGGQRLDDENYGLTVKAIDPATGEVISSASKTVAPDRVLGNVALVSHPGTRTQDATPALFAFEQWQITGGAVEHDRSHALGPIIGTQYTLSRGTLKLSAQFLPMAEDDPTAVRLQVWRDRAWQTVATTDIATPDNLAVFTVPDWDDTADTPFRVTYRLGGDDDQPLYFWAGTIRKDPVDKEEIVVAGFTGSLQAPWGNRDNWVNEMFFPHADLTSRVAQHDPDLLFFSGDQIYEGTPTFADRQNIMVDYHYKWAMHIWAYRELMRDRPTVTIPDDHDVYQGNYWGEGGRKAPGADNTGGYVHPAEFVSMVHRTHTSHMPTPADPTPILQDIPVYHTDLVYGRVSFAVLADRMFKSGCADHGLPPSGTGRPDHYNNADFDPADLDLPGLVLLGDRQLDFLNRWAGDWKGADMKMALSQTIFANMATHHGNLTYLIADLDSNGWPQTGRNKALEELRRGFAFHLAGDQHLATLVQHGIDKHGDAVWSFCVPSVANAYPRAWAPEITNPYVYPEDPATYLGERLDGFKNKVTVYAAANPGKDSGHEPSFLHDKMPGYGIVRVNKKDHTYTAECWPRYADPTDASQQYPGWPRTIDQLSNFAKTPLGYLPTLKITGLDNPVVQVFNQRTGELVYALRLPATTFSPMVFEASKYNVIVSDPDLGKRKSLMNVEIAEDGETIEVAF